MTTRTSWAYCPKCRRDLNGDNDSFVDDMGSYVRYTCATCGFNSQWDFDTPVPVYLYEWSADR
jgi:transposase-like protein